MDRVTLQVLHRAAPVAGFKQPPAEVAKDVVQQTAILVEFTDCQRGYGCILVRSRHRTHLLQLD
jgi:hypothetical protein